MHLNKKNIFLLLTGFQLTWIACVFGEYYNEPLIGVFFASIYLIFFFFFNKNKIRSLQICLIFSIIGYSFDSFMNYFNFYLLESRIKIGLLPIWLIFLWLSFATLLVDLLNFLKNRPKLGFLLGSILVPPTYYVGLPLGIAKTDNLIVAMVLIGIFWGILLISYSFYLRRYDIIL